MNEDKQLNAVAQIDIDTSTLGKVTIKLPAHLAEHAERVKVDYTVLPKNVYDSIVRCPRDKRAMNHMESDVTQQGKVLLSEWAKWQRGAMGAGYPTIEPFARLVTPTPSDTPLGPLPDEVAKTDRAVCVLRFRDHGMLWLAIEQFFLKDDDVSVKCSRLGKSRAGFYRLVDRACRRVWQLVAEY